MTPDLSLKTAARIAAPPERVYAAWLDPATLARFMFPADGMETPEVSTDPRAGGRFDIVMKKDGKAMPHWGIYRELAPHSRIVFTWNSPFAEADSLVTLTFAAAGEATDVTLVHDRFLSEEMRDNHEAGWTRILAVLGEMYARETSA